MARRAARTIGEAGIEELPARSTYRTGSATIPSSTSWQTPTTTTSYIVYPAMAWHGRLSAPSTPTLASVAGTKVLLAESTSSVRTPATLPSTSIWPNVMQTRRPARCTTTS